VRPRQEAEGARAGGAVDAPLERADRPGADPRPLGQGLLGQPGGLPLPPQQQSERLPGRRRYAGAPAPPSRPSATAPHPNRFLLPAGERDGVPVTPAGRSLARPGHSHGANHVTFV